MENFTQANWIWTSDWQESDKQSPKLVLFRKKISLTTAAIRSKINITADSRYKLYINGKMVDVGPLKGNKKKWYYDTHDVTSFLHIGDNTIAVSVLRYPTLHFKGNYGVERTALPGLYVTGSITTQDQQITISTDETWACFVDRGFKIVSEADDFAPLQIYEDYHASAALKNWKTSQDHALWHSAIMYSKANVPNILQPEHLVSRTVPFMTRKLKRFSSVKQLVKSKYSKQDWEQLLEDNRSLNIPANQTEIVEISAGAEETGYLHLAVSGGKNATIKIVQSEAYVKPETEVVNGLTIHVKDDREDAENGQLVGFHDTYKVAGDGTFDYPEVYSPFWLRTFRFIRLEITTADEPIQITQFDYEYTAYPLHVTTKVETSDSSLSDIWKLSERTLRLCMHETYEDCPYYEQQQYAADTRTQILYTYAIAADDRLARKAINDFQCSQFPDGVINASSPNFEENIIPTFSISYIYMVYDHMMYFDDLDLLNDNMPTIDRILSYFDRNLTAEGYVDNLGGLNQVSRYWSFIDWTTQWNKTSGVPTAVKQGPITMESLWYLYGLQAAVKIAEHLKRTDLVENYHNRIQTLANAIKNNCIGKNGMLQDGPGVEEYSQHAQVFGILTGILSKEQGRINLSKTIQHRSEYAQCSVALAFYLFAAMKTVGLYAFSDQYWDIWRRMLKKNCTTSVEAEAGERSECHAWGALALYELPSTILGVTPASPGYRKANIDPTVGYLHSASGTVLTPRGLISVNWRLRDGEMLLEYDSPIEVVLKENDHGKDF